MVVIGRATLELTRSGGGRPEEQVDTAQFAMSGEDEERYDAIFRELAGGNTGADGSIALADAVNIFVKSALSAEVGAGRVMAVPGRGAHRRLE